MSNLLSVSLLAFALPSASEWMEAIPIIFSLILIEGLLSVDNALAIAAMANHLPEHQKRRALRWGIVGAYGFRGLAMAGAAFIIENPWLKIIGAAYLIYLMCEHFSEVRKDEKAQAIDPSKVVVRGFWSTVMAIEFMDLSLSVDNVVAAVAMSPKLWVVCLGVFIGILALRFVAGACLKLLEKYPVLEHTAFILIGYVGAILVFELLTEFHVSAVQKFMGIVLLTLATVVYSSRSGLQRVLGPGLRVIRWPMVGVSVIIGAVLSALGWPFRLMWRSLRSSGSVA